MVWLPVVDGAPFWDDRGNLLENPWLHAGWATFAEGALGPHLGHWQPLSWLSLRADLWLFGPLAAALRQDGGVLGVDAVRAVATPHLIGNCLLHAATAFALTLVLGRALGLGLATKGLPAFARWMAAGLAATLWAVHPCRVESVAWVTERRDVLAAALLAPGIATWLTARARQLGIAGGDWRRPMAVAFALFLLSGLAKAWVLALPGALFALEWALFRPWLRPAGVAQALRHAALWLGLALPVALLAARAQIAVGAAAGAEGLPLAERALLAAAAPWRYLGLTLWPADLSPLHALHAGLAYEPQTLAMVAATVIAVFVLLRGRLRWPALFAAALGMMAWLGPVLGLLQSGVQAIAERYLHLAHWPLALLLAQGAASAMGRGVVFVAGGRWRPGPWTLPVAVGLAMLLAPLLVRTFLWQGVWLRGEEALWTAAIDADGQTRHAHLNRASLRLRRGALDEAWADLQAGRAGSGKDGRYWSMLAAVQRARGDLAAARRSLDVAVDVDPLDPLPRCNRGGLRAAAGDVAGALADFNAGAAIDRGSSNASARAECLLNRAVLRVQTGAPAAALADVEAALPLLPVGHAQRERALGMARALVGPAGR